MKFWIRILVALAVVVVIGFGAWAFFFREDERLVSYNRACEIINFKYSMGLKSSLDELKSFDYFGENKENKIVDNSGTKKQILQIREDMMSLEIVETFDDGGQVTCYFDSYVVIDENLDNAMQRFLPYIKKANVSDTTIRDIKRIVKKYKSDLLDFDSSLKTLMLYQKEMEDTETNFEVLLGHYRAVKIKYKSYLNDGAMLSKYMLDAIKQNNGILKYDARLALMDSYVRSLAVSTSVENLREPFFSHDAHLVLDKIEKFDKGESIFEEYTEYDFLQAYNTLINNFGGVLDSAYTKHNIEKKKMAENENLSDVKIEAQPSLVTVLNVIGY